MAVSKKPAAGEDQNPDPKQPLEEVKPPSFKAEVDKTRAAAATGADDVQPDPQEPKPGDKKFDAVKFLSELPEDQRNEINKVYKDSFNSWMVDTFGGDENVLPLLDECAADPEFRKALAKLSREGKVDRKVADFLLSDAYEIASAPPAKPGEQPAAQSGMTPEERAQFDALVKDRDDRAAAEKNAKRVEGIQKEYVALAKEVPAIQFKAADDSDPGYALASMLINTMDKFNTAEEARKSGKVWTLKEVYEAWTSTSKNRDDAASKMVAAPATSIPEIAPPEQAPRSDADARRIGLQRLARVGGFRNLALSGKK